MVPVIQFIRLRHIARRKKYLFMLICALEVLLPLSSKKIGNYHKELLALALILINMAYRLKESPFFSTQVKNIEKINFLSQVFGQEDYIVLLD
jgi:uncharacterized membrane protein